MANPLVYRQRRRDKSGNIRMVSEIVRRTPSQEELKRLISYDPETGVFTHRESRGKGVAGQEAGNIAPSGYRMIGVLNRPQRAHRLAFLYMTGSMPSFPLTVDHINGIRDDNRWCNLRLATMTQQTWNSPVRANNKIGLKGASLCKTTGRWISVIYMAGKRKFLGRFDTAMQAHNAYVKAATELRGSEWTKRSNGEPS